MDIRFSETPAMFGTLHFLILAAVLFLSAILVFVFREREEKTLIRGIGLMGIIMLLMEVWKQWFVAKYVYPDIRSMWYFPWQLCSMSMYVSALVPVLRGKAQDTALVFLATYGVIAAVFALAVPADMMRPQILLFIHGFLYHAIMLAESIAALFILKRRTPLRFLPATVLFLVMAVIAEIINMISPHIVGENGLNANMFNITPLYPSTQPVFHEIAVRFGIWPEIILYLGLIILGSFGLYLLVKRFTGRAGRSN